MEVIARSSDKNGDRQTYRSHISGVRKISMSLATKISKKFKKEIRDNFVKTVAISAEYHDCGKLHLCNQVGLYNGNLKRLPYDHTKDGPRLLFETSPSLRDAAMISVAHHSCLDLDSIKLLSTWKRCSFEEIHKKEMDKVLKVKSNLSTIVPLKNESLSRMGLSCLVNGDWDDSAKAKGCFVPECKPTKWEERLEKLTENVKTVTEKKSKLLTTLNPKDAVVKFQTTRHNLRKKLWDISGSVGIKQNISVLSATVGMGKTFSFLRLALRKAIKQNSPHIFIVAPYNHVVDQLVNVLRENLVLDGENPEDIVGNHTCTVEYSDYNIQNSTSRWRCPIIVTSSVQFFETMSSNVAGKLVKLVEVPNSVVVIDEWHSIMEESLIRFYWNEIGNLVNLFNTKFILSSGSMTRFWDTEFCNKFTDTVSLKIKEVVPKSFKNKSIKSEKGRVKYSPLGTLNPQELADDVIKYGGKGKKTIVLLSTTQNVAIMTNLLLNNGRNIYTVFGSLIDKDSSEHVEKIKNDNSDWIIVCTTSIESGIDISSEVAYSVERSIMSQIQLGGRVNREGNFKESQIFYFKEGTDGFNVNPSFLEPARISGELIGNISDADLSAKDYLFCFTIKTNSKLNDAVKFKRFTEIAKESRIIKDGRGSVLVGPKAKDIYERLIKKDNGEKVSVSSKEIAQNSVPMPTINPNKFMGFIESDFLPVPGFNNEDGKSLLMYYLGNYDPKYFGIWVDKI